MFENENKMNDEKCRKKLQYVASGLVFFVLFFFFKQKTAYEIRNCDWSSDVCSSDLSCTEGTV